MSDDIDAAAAAAAAAFLAGSQPSTGGNSSKNKKKKKGAKKVTAENHAAIATNDQPISLEAPAEVSTASSISTEAAQTEENTREAGDVTKNSETDVDDAAKVMAALGLSNSAPATSGGAKDKKKKKKGGNKQSQTATKPLNSVARLALERLAKEKEAAELAAKEEEEARLKAEAERLAEEEAARKQQEAKERKKRLEKEKKERDRAAGKAVTKAAKAREAKARAARERLVASGLIKLDENGKVISDVKAPKVSSSHAMEKDSKKVEPTTEESVNAESESKDIEVDVKPTSAESGQPDGAEDVQNSTEDSTSTGEVVGKVLDATEPISPDSNVDDDDDWETAPVVTVELAEEDAAEKLIVDDDDDEVYGAANASKEASAPKAKKKPQKKGKKGLNDSTEGGDKLTAKERVAAVKLQREREIERAREEREERIRIAMANRSKDDLRSPICCVMGHVDTGKTKLLDKIRRTNVQEGEAGGITQQIGATYFPIENLKKITANLSEKLRMDFKVPGLLVIDTPGHECFSNLRNRGSSTADVAILVVDIVHGLEPQTIESINMLRSRNTQFVVALNKVDRLYGWKPCPGMPIRKALREQNENVLSEFDTRVKFVTTQLMEQGLNSSLYYENKDFVKILSIVPTSAHSGEGIPDLILLLVQLTQRMMVDRLMFSDIPEATVLDVKKVEGVGTTIDVLLINGMLKVGNRIVVAGINGPITTQIRALLTPGEMKEMRVKSEYVHHEEIRAAIGVKIVAQNLDDAIAGTIMMVSGDDDDDDELRQSVMQDVEGVLNTVSKTGRGVCVQASTIGSLEALLEFLRVSNIPVAAVNIGPITKRDVARASIMLEHQKEYACILAFDVKVLRDASEAAEEAGVKIFTADIVYHLFDYFTKYMREIEETRRQDANKDVVFPCILRILPQNVYMKRNPLVMGVEVVEGVCRVGTPIVVPDRLIPDEDNPGEQKYLELGVIESIEKDGVAADNVRRNSAVCIKIQGNASQTYVTYGRHFDASNSLYSKISRKSIDVLKEFFKDEMENSDWALVIKLKSVFNIA